MAQPDAAERRVASRHGAGTGAAAAPSVETMQTSSIVDRRFIGYVSSRN